ncbi:hypothetical protein [Streptomyces sp. NPDC014006]|uniref:hypothetical protein n=1 Tax=Streptomyces sp. NPDC014006 TaxID=3364870 RepID=UPI0036F5F638
MHRRWGRLSTTVSAAALSLLAASATAAQAAPAADPVDVETHQSLDHDTVTPGGTVGVRASARAVTGQVPRLAIRLALPAGVTYQSTRDDAADADCAPSADGRTVTCLRKDGHTDSLSAYVSLKVGEDVPAGTELTFTSTADIGDVVDAEPGNNTATGKVAVRRPGDLGIAWQAPAGPVKPGQDVKTSLVVTNHGPGAVPLQAVRLDMNDSFGPRTMDRSCWWDPYLITCDVFRELAPGETVTLPFTWNFPAEAAGTTQRVPTGLYDSSPLDGNPANDKTTLVLNVAKGTATPTAKPTATAAPAPTHSPTGSPQPTSTASATAPATGTGTDATPQGGNGQLAATGTGPLTAAGATAAALTVAGGALALARRTRRREH